MNLQTSLGHTLYCELKFTLSPAPGQADPKAIINTTRYTLVDTLLLNFGLGKARQAGGTLWHTLQGQTEERKPLRARSFYIASIDRQASKNHHETNHEGGVVAHGHHEKRLPAKK